MSQPAVEKLILVHPHTAYDGARTIVDHTELRLAKFSERRDSVLVLRGYKEDDQTRERTEALLDLHLESAGSFPAVHSVAGELTPSKVRELVKPGSRISLLGGIVGQCHQKTFQCITEFLDNHPVKDVTVAVPYDGCYFQHSWSEWGDLIPGTWNRTGRFDGARIGGYLYEMAGKDSYSLREVASKVFTEPDQLLHHRQMRDEEGRALTATAEQFRGNLERHFLGGYFLDPRCKPQFSRPHRREFLPDEFLVHF